MVHGIFRVSVKTFTMERLLLSSVMCEYQAWPCTPQGDIDNE